MSILFEAALGLMPNSLLKEETILGSKKLVWLSLLSLSSFPKMLQPFMKHSLGSFGREVAGGVTISDLINYIKESREYPGLQKSLKV